MKKNTVTKESLWGEFITWLLDVWMSKDDHSSQLDLAVRLRVIRKKAEKLPEKDREDLFNAVSYIDDRPTTFLLKLMTPMPQSTELRSLMEEVLLGGPEVVSHDLVRKYRQIPLKDADEWVALLTDIHGGNFMVVLKKAHEHIRRVNT